MKLDELFSFKDWVIASNANNPELMSQALSEASLKFQAHPSTASLTWANTRYQRLLRESEYKDSYEDEEELENGDYVRDEQDSSGEVFRLSGYEPGARRCRIDDKHGSGWYIMPSRLVKVTDSAAIDRWFGSHDDQEGDY